MSEIDRTGIERNANGEEEPHSADPELWNFDGTEVDLSDGHKYKMGKQLWYIQDRAKDAIKAGKPIAGQPMNDKARNSGRTTTRIEDDLPLLSCRPGAVIAVARCEIYISAALRPL